MGWRLTIDQQKLLASALRVRIAEAIQDTPLTAKEVSRVVGATVGNTHYHLQRLALGGLAEVVEALREDGHFDKRYRAVQYWSDAEELAPSVRASHLLEYQGTLWLTVAETGQLVNELKAVLYRWQSAFGTAKGRSQPLSLAVSVNRINLSTSRNDPRLRPGSD